METQQKSNPAPLPRLPDPPRWQEKTVMVVDDLKVNYLLIKAMLGKTGAQILWAENGYQAIECLEMGQQIDVVLMDYNMPGIDGLETTLRLKSIRPGIPVISQSTFTDREEFNKAEAPYDDYIAKPINSKELITKLCRFIQ